jgi:hypothetical protein
MRKVLVALVASLAFTSSPVWAASSAGDLLAACRSAPETRGDEICNAYINGFVNGVLVDQVAREGSQPICIDNTNTGAVRKALTEFLNANPTILRLDSGSVVGAAYQRLYPCPKPN